MKKAINQARVRLAKAIMPRDEGGPSETRRAAGSEPQSDTRHLPRPSDEVAHPVYPEHFDYDKYVPTEQEIATRRNRDRDMSRPGKLAPEVNR